MTIPPRFLDDIRNRLTLSTVIGKRVRVMRAGREYKACCPFHKEKTPSFTINDDKQFYHCFGCGAHGDVINFVMQHDNLSFPDAVDMLAVEAGLQVPRPDPEAAKKAERQKDLHALMDQAASWFMAQLDLAGHNDVKAYAARRGLDDKVCKQFRIGFAPSDPQALRRHLKGQGFTDKDMLEAGLLKIREGKAEPYAFFRERLMFPVGDRKGRVIAFGGRILPDHMRPPDRSDFKPPKYINSADTPLFDKSRTLYGESFARQAARDGHSILVTEGYMDVIACHKAGFKGAVAPMGTALTEEQILALWSLIPDDSKIAYLCFDGDNPGRQAAGRACERVMPLLRPGHGVRFVFLPEGEDPDSLLTAGNKTGFVKALESSLSLLDFLWASHMAGQDVGTPELRAGVIKAMENQVRQIADRDVQMHYQEALRQRVRETFFSRRPQGSGYGGNNKWTPHHAGMKMRRPSAPLRQALPLLAAVLNHPQLFETHEEMIVRLDTGYEEFNRLHRAAIDFLIAWPGLDRSALQQHLKEQGFAEAMEALLSESVYMHGGFARPGAAEEDIAGAWGDMFQALERRTANMEMKSEIKQAVLSADPQDEERVFSLLQRHQAETI